MYPSRRRNNIRWVLDWIRFCRQHIILNMSIFSLLLGKFRAFANPNCIPILRESYVSASPLHFSCHPHFSFLVSFFVLFISQVGSMNTLVNINYALQFRWPFISRSLCTFLFLEHSLSLNSTNHRTPSPCTNLVQSTSLESFFRPAFPPFLCTFSAPSFLPPESIPTNESDSLVHNLPFDVISLLLFRLFRDCPLRNRQLQASRQLGVFFREPSFFSPPPKRWTRSTEPLPAPKPSPSLEKCFRKVSSLLLSRLRTPPLGC